MSRHGEIRIEFGDDEYTFRLGHRELEAIQVASDAGPPRIADRLRPYDAVHNPHGDNWRVQDIREVIRVALVGGGMEQGLALSLVRKFVDGVPLIVNRIVAWSIIQAAIVGVPDEVLGKGEGVEEMMKASDSPTTRSPSDLSSDMPQ